MKMKKLLALLLALIMVFALVACSKDDGKEKEKEEEKPLSEQIVGTWSATLSMNGEMMEMPSFTGSLETKVDVTFKDDNTFTMKMDAEAFANSIEKNRKELAEVSIQILVEMTGSREAAEATAKALNMTLEEYGDYAVNEIKKAVPEMSENGKWSLEDNKLTFEDDDGKTTRTISIEADKMTWTNDEELKESFGSDTVEFTRV